MTLRDFIHKFLLVCGAGLVFLRFLPAKPGGFLSRLFFDEVVHDRISALAVNAIVGLGVDADQYQTQVAGLESLAHVIALIVQALGIALTFFVIARWVR